MRENCFEPIQGKTYITVPLNERFVKKVFPVLVGLPLLVFALWHVFFPGMILESTLEALDYPLTLLGAIALLLLAHEICHFLSFPKFGFDGNSVVGINMKAGAPFVARLEPQARNRSILTGLMPLIVLTVLPLIICLFYGYDGRLALLSFMNAIGSAADAYVVFKIIKFAKPGTYIDDDAGGVYIQLTADDCTEMAEAPRGVKSWRVGFNKD